MNAASSKQIFIVTGAPGAGKTTALEALLQLRDQSFVALDIDWLIAAASELAGQDVVFHPPSWRPFRRVWFELLQAILRNHQTPVLFAHINHQDVAELMLPKNIIVRWALLDCSDEARRARVAGRPRMTEAHVRDALKDAVNLRGEQHDLVVDTTELSPAKVAQQLKQWVEQDAA